jgi:hypothetical protein
VYKIYCFSIVDNRVFVVVVVVVVDRDMVLKVKNKFEGKRKLYSLRLDAEDQSLVAIGGTTVVDVGI